LRQFFASFAVKSFSELLTAKQRIAEARRKTYATPAVGLLPTEA